MRTIHDSNTTQVKAIVSTRVKHTILVIHTNMREYAQREYSKQVFFWLQTTAVIILCAGVKEHLSEISLVLC